MSRFSLSALLVLGFAGSAFCQMSDADKLQGTWEITALVDEGALVPDDLLRSRFAQDARFTIEGQSISCISPSTLQKKTMLFVLDEKASPKTLDIAGSEKTGGKGIYVLAEDTLMICVSEPEFKFRPTEFSARKDSPQMLMTLKRIKAPAVKSAPPVIPVVAPSPAPAALPPLATTMPAPPRVETVFKEVPPPAPSRDEELRKALLGTWGHQDDEWLTLFSVNSDGTFSSTKNYKKKFGRLFNDDTRSSGTWKLQDGVVLCSITASTDKELRNQIFSYRIRSISATELIAVDQFGRLRREWKAR